MKIDKTKQKVDITQFSKYSFEQQCGIVKLLIEDVEFRTKAIELIDINSLNADETLRMLGSVVKDLHNSNIMVDYDILRTYINSKVSNQFQREKALEIINTTMETTDLSSSSIQYLKDDLFPLLEFQEGRRFFGVLNEMMKKEKMTREDVLKAFTEYERRTAFKDCTFQVLDSSLDAVKKLLEKNTYQYVQTYSKMIDMCLGGGLRKGDVGLLIAGSGVAKTCITTGFVCGNAYNGNKVAHFVLEDKEEDILKKYIAFISNISPYEQYKRKDEVLKRIEEYKTSYTNMQNNIRPVFCCNNKNEIKLMSVEDIDNELQRMIDDGFHPDMVVVDYYDRIKKKGKDIWIEDERIINALLNIATKYNVAMWVPSQGGKSAQNKNIDLDLDNMSGGTWKTYAAQIVLGVQKKNDDSENEFTLSVLKNRYYNKYRTMKLKFNNGTCRFCNDEEEIRRLNETNETIDNMFEDYRIQIAKQSIKK